MAISLAFINARLWTPPADDATVPNDSEDISTDHDSIGIVDDKISMIGTTNDVLGCCNANTTIIDAKGGMLLPGFTDCHVHFLDSGKRLLSVKLRNCTSKEEVKKALKEHVKNRPAGSWILGGDWDHHMWGGQLPNKTWIDDVSPDNPVWLNRLDGHMALANSVAMKLANIDKDTSDVPGGTIVRFDNGEPTGMFKDNATNLIARCITRPSREEEREALESAMSYVAERGVTKVHTMVTVDCPCGLWPKDLGKDADKQDMEIAFEEISLYREFMQQGKLRTRIRAALPVASWKRVMTDLLEMEPVLFQDIEAAQTSEDKNRLLAEMKSKRQRITDSTDFLQIGVLKAMIDGSLGSHTAAFFDDYVDTPGYKGTFNWDPSILQQYVLDASVNGLHVCVHAIGDHANKETLDLFENVTQKINECFGTKYTKIDDGNLHLDLDLRFRIEHAQHISARDMKRFSDLDVVASMQMSHLSDDGRWASSLIGEERIKESWPMKSLLKHNAVVALGSDWFVTEPSPLQGIYDAVTRRTIDGMWPGGLVPSERVSVEQALIGYTSAAAYAACEENLRGTIGVGKLADLVLLDKHLLEVDIDEIPKTNVLVTVVGGQLVFNKLNTFRADGSSKFCVD